MVASTKYSGTMEEEEEETETLCLWLWCVGGVLVLVLVLVLVKVGDDIPVPDEASIKLYVQTLQLKA